MLELCVGCPGCCIGFSAPAALHARYLRAHVFTHLLTPSHILRILTLFLRLSLSLQVREELKAKYLNAEDLQQYAIAGTGERGRRGRGGTEDRRYWGGREGVVRGVEKVGSEQCAALNM